MKSNITKKFIDILFEPVDTDETPEVVADSFEEPENVKPVKDDNQEQFTAKDVMYKKSGQSAFLDYVNIPSQEETEQTAVKKQEKVEDEVYEFSPNISPIFGVIGSKETKTASPAKVNTSQTNRPEDHHLDIVTSPIYGYSSKEDAQKQQIEVNNSLFEEENEEELHMLFETQDNMIAKDEEINLFDEYEEEL